MDVELPSRYICERKREIDRRKKRGLPMNLTYDQVTDLLDPFYSVYECSDGRMFYLVAPCNETHQERTLKALGLWEEMSSRNIPQGAGCFPGVVRSTVMRSMRAEMRLIGHSGVQVAFGKTARNGVTTFT